ASSGYFVISFVIRICFVILVSLFVILSGTLPLRRRRPLITIRQFFAMAQGRATPEERTYTV
ncbi:MAG TPA: hypothetical protein VJ809_05535, partial [Pirellulales bacterium]|nr:hypothetical protein [Pirellulales bacterium]